MRDSIDKTIKERGSVHGCYRDQCGVAETIEAAMRAGKNWASLNPCQMQAMKMIAVKIARILTGDPDFSDHWHDIAGYATLAEMNPTIGMAPNAVDAGESFFKETIMKDVENWADEDMKRAKEFLRNNHPEKTATSCLKHNET